MFNFNNVRQYHRNDSVDYNDPSRYLYEFFTHKNYMKFREKFLKLKSVDLWEKLEAKYSKDIKFGTPQK